MLKTVAIALLVVALALVSFRVGWVASQPCNTCRGNCGCCECDK